MKRRSLKNMPPDHDPNNPYHYHDAEGNKVVISPKDWEANVGKPYFREIEAAVKAEQAAYPSPEYEVNPTFMRDLNSSVATVRGKNGMINYVGYKNQLPQGYTINENGIIFDDKGQAYVQESYPQSNRFTYNTDHPLQFTFNQGKPIERNVNFYPVDMDMRVKEPLPIDRVMNVKEEYENAISNIPTKFKMPWLGRFAKYLPEGYTQSYIDAPSYITKEQYDYLMDYIQEDYKKHPEYYQNISANNGKSRGLDALLYEMFEGEGKGKWVKPPRKEAEKKAVIKIGHLKKRTLKRNGGIVYLKPF